MKLRICLILYLFCTVTLHAYERISHFVSDIVINQDSSLLVTETIKVFAEGDQIRHGIVREFPTKYSGHAGTIYNTHFELQSVKCNDKRVAYHVENASNGKRIYIGDKQQVLSPGTYTYKITYTTNRQLGFFADHDELYWNVTGNGWRLPIMRAEAYVHLPDGASPTKMKAWTGAQGSRDEHYSSDTKNNIIHFYTTKLLYPYEGLTVAVGFDKGFVIEPSFMQKAIWLLIDNWFVTFILVLLVLFMIGYIIAFVKNRPGTIIPHFAPPKDMTPSQIGYMTAMKFNPQHLAADVVNLAVRGFIKIDKTASKEYQLELIDKKGATEYESNLLEKLFAKKNKTKRISVKENLQKVVKLCEINASSSFDTYMHEFNFFKFVRFTIGGLLYFASFVAINVAVGFVIIGLILPLLDLVFLSNNIYIRGIHIAVSLLMFFAWLGILLRVVSSKLLNLLVGRGTFFIHYTFQGRKLQDKIDGFKLYLKTVELDRMKIAGTPPDRTPQLYEKLLPYAIALGVEKQWTKQFASVFKKVDYKPDWYVGSDFYYGHGFRSSGFAGSFSKTISSAASSPGSSSAFGGSGGGGFGGGGCSGGGGGGGGGGGW